MYNIVSKCLKSIETYLFVLFLTVKNVVAVGEGAALDILAGDAHVVAVHQQRAPAESLAH